MANAFARLVMVVISLVKACSIVSPVLLATQAYRRMDFVSLVPMEPMQRILASSLCTECVYGPLRHEERHPVRTYANLAVLALTWPPRVLQNATTVHLEDFVT